MNTVTPAHVPRHILLATDLSEASAPAAAWAGLLVRTFGARLTVVHAEHLPLPPYFSPEQHRRLEAEARAARETATRLVAETVAPQVGFLPEARIEEGHPADAIARCAAACDADLVVLGTHGRRGVRRLWLGSVAESVLHDADRPVLIAHQGTEVAPPREIVLACEPLDVPANQLATHWAHVFGAHLLCRAPDALPAADEPGGTLYIAAGDHPERALRRTLAPVLALPRRPNT